MNLAQLIHKALTNPQYRLALETGAVQEVPGLTSEEVAAAAAVLRANFKKRVNELFNEVHKDSNSGWA